jgi:hypothetical protein
MPIISFGLGLIIGILVISGAFDNIKHNEKED